MLTSSKSNRDLAGTFFRNGAQAEKNRDFERAIRFYETALAIYEAKIGAQNPDLLDVMLPLIQIYHAQGLVEQLTGLLQRAAALAPQAQVCAAQPMVANGAVGTQRKAPQSPDQEICGQDR